MGGVGDELRAILADRPKCKQEKQNLKEDVLSPAIAIAVGHTRYCSKAPA